MRIITKTALGLGTVYGLYLVACNHFIYFDSNKIKLLKKKEPTFARTFFSTSLKSNEAILADDVLREAGIGDLLVEMGLLAEKRRDYIIAEIEKKNAKEDSDE